IAQISEGCREIRLQRECFLIAGERFLAAVEPEKRKTEIGMGIRRARVERNRALEDSLGVLGPPAVEDGHPQQMHGFKKIRLIAEHAPAKRLDIDVPACAVGCERSQHRFGQFPEFLLLLLVLNGAGAGGALQGVFRERISFKDSTTGIESLSDSG